MRRVGFAQTKQRQRDNKVTIFWHDELKGKTLLEVPEPFLFLASQAFKHMSCIGD